MEKYNEEFSYTSPGELVFKDNRRAKEFAKALNDEGIMRKDIAVKGNTVNFIYFQSQKDFIFNTLYSRINESVLSVSKFDKLVEASLKKPEYQLYHDSYTSAIESALAYAEEYGYDTDAEERAEIIGMQSSRPKSGQTERVILPLYKNGKLQKKYLNIQVYNRGLKSGNTYELNAYIA